MSDQDVIGIQLSYLWLQQAALEKNQALMFELMDHFSYRETWTILESPEVKSRRSYLGIGPCRLHHLRGSPKDFPGVSVSVRLGMKSGIKDVPTFRISMSEKSLERTSSTNPVRKNT